MPSFSTKEMKAAVYCTADKVERLPAASVDQIKELFGWLIPKKGNYLVVLAFAGHYLHKDDAKEIKALMDTQKVSIVSHTESVMVLKTKKGYLITVQVIAGSAWFVDSNRRESGDSESSFEDASDWKLTQELHGVELESDEDGDDDEDDEEDDE